jgi:NAD(P)H-hydrate repair Nnr-like enzyme with NAD(P)H-hydrate dehydratase domain
VTSVPDDSTKRPALGPNDAAIDRAFALKVLPRRGFGAHQWGVGGLVIVAGAPGFAGAAILSAMAAGRAGAGIMNVAAPRSLTGAIVVHVPEAATIPLPEGEAAGVRVAADAYDAADRADAVVVVTEWDDFKALDLPALADRRSGDLVLDGRGVVDVESARAAGLQVTGFGW